jgi:hypothetical protein
MRACGMWERAAQLHHDNAPAHSTALVQAFFFFAKHYITQVCQPPYSPDLAPCNFWLFPNLKSPLKGRRLVNATVTQYTSSVNGVSQPTDWPHGRVTVHGCTVRSPLTGCQGHANGSRDIQNGRIFSGEPSYLYCASFKVLAAV